MTNKKKSATDTQATFVGQKETTYLFRVQAVDNVNNSTWAQSNPVQVSSAVKKYYHFGSQRVAMRDGDVVYYLHGDHLGSTSLTTDENGAKVAEARYLPYGQERWRDSTLPTNNLPTDFNYTGQRNEAYISEGMADSLFEAPKQNRQARSMIQGWLNNEYGQLAEAVVHQGMHDAVQMQMGAGWMMFRSPSGGGGSGGGIPTLAGRGSTADPSKGTTLPRNLHEQLAVKQARYDPTAGKELPFSMKDGRWHASEGWVKMQQTIKSKTTSTTVHYNYNPKLNLVDDFKILIPGVHGAQ
jgi:hypothetical protein